MSDFERTREIARLQSLRAMAFATGDMAEADRCMRAISELLGEQW